MNPISPKYQKIIDIFLEKENIQSSHVHNELVNQGEKTSLVTVKRALSEMAKEGILTASGLGRSAAYSISVKGRIFADVNSKQYCALEPDKRHGLGRYNFSLFDQIPKDIFQDNELKILANAYYRIQKENRKFIPYNCKKRIGTVSY